MEKKIAGIIAGAVVVVVVIIIISLVATSLEKLNSYEVGLKYNTQWKTLADKSSSEGLHTGPPGFEFIKFPSVFKSISDTYRCLNKDGVNIVISLSYQYKARINDLRKIITLFRNHESYVEVLKVTATAAIHEACSLYNTSQFQAERGNFQETVSAKLSQRLHLLHCEVSEIQVSSIARPSAYEAAIKAKEATRENINVALNERPRKITEANTAKREAETQAAITIAKAQSQARIIHNRANSTASAILNEYATETETYMEVMSSGGLGFSEKAFISYMGIRAVSNAKNPVYIGMKGPAKTSYVTP